MKHLLAIILCLSSAVSFRAHAEGGCPPGQVLQQGQGWQSCVALPAASQGASGGDGTLWQNSWQAVVTDSEKGILGTSVGKISQGTAENAAMDDCRAKGGQSCELQMSYANGCMAVVVGANHLQIQVGSSKASAEKKSMDKCEAEDTKCVTYYAECSKAKRIQ